MSILIVDDSQDQRVLLKAILHRAGYSDVVTAESASAALEQLTEPSGPHPPVVDLILMDYLMPEIDGVAACRLIKAHHNLQDIPVIIVTAKNDSSNLREAFAAGATDYISKPVNSVELLARVSSALTLKRERDCRKARERELLARNEELQRALREVKTLRGLIPICASCKKIRNDLGAWQQLEEYLQEHSEAEFSHGLCTSCIKKLYPGVYED